MNFDKESKSEEKKIFFFLVVVFGGGGGGEGGGWRRRIPTEKNKTQNNRYLLIFCAHAPYTISSSWLKRFSSFNTNKRSNGQVRGITLPMFYRIQSKVL